MPWPLNSRDFFRDLLGSLRMTADDFGWVTRELMKSAEENCGGRLVSVLEGGYDLEGSCGLGQCPRR